MITITDNAALQIHNLCKKSNKFIRLTIESGGCQGYNKVWDIVSEIDSDDTIFDCNEGKLLIDSVSTELLSDAVIDYKVDLAGSYFVVDIPAAISTCGCGTSFNL